MGTEVEVVDATAAGMVLYDVTLFGQLKWQDPQDMGRKIGERMNRATSVDELFTVLEGSNTQGLIGRKVEILGADFYAYQSEEGVIPNAICQAADIATGEVLEFATTSGFCTAFLRKVQLLNGFPVQVKVTETLTRSGQKAINFEKP